VIEDIGFPDSDFIYICVLNSYSDEENKIITAVYGNHRHKKTNEDVQLIHLNLVAKNLDYIPRGFEEFFPNLNAIGVNGGKITKLDGDELENYENLERFSIQNSQLEFVPGNLFSNNKKIKNISFFRSNIKYFGEGLLDGLNDLERVDFRFDFSSRNCIHEIAETPSEIEQLKRKLRENCNDQKLTEDYFEEFGYMLNDSDFN
jgi:hypothetical protein